MNHKDDNLETPCQSLLEQKVTQSCPSDVDGVPQCPSPKHKIPSSCNTKSYLVENPCKQTKIDETIMGEFLKQATLTSYHNSLRHGKKMTFLSEMYTFLFGPTGPLC